MLVYHVGRQPMADWKERVRILKSSDEWMDEVLWRLEQYLHMGFDVEDAKNLASRGDIDWHLARDLVRNGCSHDLVIRIVS